VQGPMIVTLPFVLLLLDYWPLRRMGEASPAGSVSASQLLRLVREKLPLFVLSAASCVITYFAQLRGGGIGPDDDFPANPNLECDRVIRGVPEEYVLAGRPFGFLFPTRLPSPRVSRYGRSQDLPC